MDHYRHKDSGRYEGLITEKKHKKKSYKRPIKGEKGTPPKKDTGDYKAPKKTKKKPTSPIKGWGGSSY